MRQHVVPLEMELRRPARGGMRARDRSRLHGVTRLPFPGPTRESGVPRAAAIGANAAAAFLVGIGATLVANLFVPAAVLCFIGALLILNLSGTASLAAPVRRRCEVIDLARARRGRIRRPQCPRPSTSHT